MRVLAVLALTGLTAWAGASAFAGEQLASLGDQATHAVPKSSVHAKGSADIGRSPLLDAWEKQQIADLVEKQLNAVARGDARVAYDFLTPETQTFYATPDAFLFAIGQQTPPVTDVSSFFMAGVEQDPFRTAQHVYLTDSDGREWLARFQVERQPGSAGWRVKRCFIEAVDGTRA